MKEGKSIVLGKPRGGWADDGSCVVGAWTEVGVLVRRVGIRCVMRRLLVVAIRYHLRKWTV